MHIYINRKEAGRTIDDLIRSIGSEKLDERKKARAALVELGSAVVPVLIPLLKDPNPGVRWEAAFILGEIHDPNSATALVKALEDEVFEVRWRAAEGLIKLRRKSLIPLLKGLHECFGSILMREGASHILRALDKSGDLAEPTIRVLKALEGIEPAVTVPWAVERALEIYAPQEVINRVDLSGMERDFILNVFLDNPQHDEE